jgi:hypothetical protein
MKKTLAIICTIALIMGVLSPLSAFAAGSFDLSDPSSTNQVDRDIISENSLKLDGTNAGGTITNGEDASPIPVYGYVGEDAEIVDPDPEDPTEPPVATPTGINVSVPTKILWAAFADDGGDIDSPDYEIKNNSTAVSLDVTVEALEANSAGAANIAIDPKLVLTLVSTGTGELGDTPITVFNKQAALPSYTSPNVLGPATGIPLEPTSWGFTIGGHYYGDFGGVAQSPEYSLTLGFDIHH